MRGCCVCVVSDPSAESSCSRCHRVSSAGAVLERAAGGATATTARPTMVRVRAEERNRSRAQIQLATAGGGDGGALVALRHDGAVASMVVLHALGKALAAASAAASGAMQHVAGVFVHPAWAFFAGYGFWVLFIVLVFVWACRLQDGWFG